MEKKDLFKKVGTIVAELNEQYQYLSERPENLNDLELELFLANSNFLTDHIEILRKINNSNKPSVNITKEGLQPANIPAEDLSNAGVTPEEKPENSPVDQPELSNISQEQAIAVKEKPKLPVDNDNSAAHPEERIPEALPEEKPEHSPVNPESTQSLQEEKAPVAENAFETGDRMEDKKSEPAEYQSVDFQRPVVEQSPAIPEEIVKEVIIPEKTISVETPVTFEEPASVPTVNEMISAQINPSTVATRFTSHPVADLKSIISLNDKLLFVKDLFNGYTLAYSEAIELLNRFDTFEAADNFLKVNYAAKNNWDDKQPTVGKLYEALNRRFAK